jgi:hypothetical protein
MSFIIGFKYPKTAMYTYPNADEIFRTRPDLP